MDIVQIAPEENDNDQGIGTSLLWGKAKKSGIFQLEKSWEDLIVAF